MTISTKKQEMLDKVWLWSIWSWPVAAVGFFTFFYFGAGLVPPPSPLLTASEHAAVFLNDPTSSKIGIIGALWFSCLLLPWYSVVTREMGKIEGEHGILAPLMWGGALVLVTFFQIISLAWLLATYRPDINPEIIRVLSEFGWFTWSMLIPTYLLQYFSLSIIGFMDDRERPTFPRWAAYMYLWVAVTGAGGALAVFVYDGPLAYNGIIGYWIPVIIFALGNFVTTWLLLKRFQYEKSLRTQPDYTKAGKLATSV
ncbi:hypothetical protein [Zhongshania marina]|uniref:Uncharacterized protein n=1 Tax=Zhongshania marina TaxID=2304603 RepID=A0ABX9W5N2_9GAMM|nr:hypothetical protein D0911_04225 [Zhongshania marina]